jgi:putative chitinase
VVPARAAGLKSHRRIDEAATPFKATQPAPLKVIAHGTVSAMDLTQLFEAAAGHSLGPMGADMGRQAAIEFPKAGITTPLRQAHFLAQAAHETGGFRYLVEIWGPTKAQAGYEGRADLGNDHPGDGKLYRGRGIFQLTGRGNYRRYGGRVSLDLVSHPERAADPAVAVTLACLYWGDHDLNAFADRDDVERITRAINGGLNGFDDRKARLAAVRKVLGC